MMPSPAWTVTFDFAPGPSPQVLLEMVASGLLQGLVGRCLQENAHQPPDHLLLCTYDPAGQPGDYGCFCLRADDLVALLVQLPRAEQQKPWTPFLQAAAAAPLPPRSRRCIFLLMTGDCVGTATLACAGTPVGAGASA